MEQQYVEGPYPPLSSEEVPDLGTEASEHTILLRAMHGRIDTYDVFTDRQFIGCLLGLLLLGGILVFFINVWIAIPIILLLLFGMVSESRWWPSNQVQETVQ
jgi:hypothetical protein